MLILSFTAIVLLFSELDLALMETYLTQLRVLLFYDPTHMHRLIGNL